jgi:hypothetical protein
MPLLTERALRQPWLKHYVFNELFIRDQINVGREPKYLWVLFASLR